MRLEREHHDVVITARDAGGRGGMPPGDPDRGHGIALMRGLTDDTPLHRGSHRGVALLRRRIGVLARTSSRRRVSGAAA